MIQASLQISGERLVFSINGAEAIKYLYEGKKNQKRTKSSTSNHMQKSNSGKSYAKNVNVKTEQFPSGRKLRE